MMEETFITYEFLGPDPLVWAYGLAGLVALYVLVPVAIKAIALWRVKRAAKFGHKMLLQMDMSLTTLRVLSAILKDPRCDEQVKECERMRRNVVADLGDLDEIIRRHS